MNIGISPDNREGVAQILNTLLADEHVLYVKTRNYHWNVVGIHFFDLHKFLESQYQTLEASIDEIAERVRTLGFPAQASLKIFLASARLAEDESLVTEAKQMIRNLLEDHEAICRQLRGDIGIVQDSFIDVATTDFLTGLLAEHEKMAWMLRSIAA
jgi:starvation-inducible DNA-binding protein